MYKSVRHALRVRYNECDPLGIVFNANYLVYTDIAVNELWREHLGGYDTMTGAGLDLAVVEAGVRYFKPLGFDDEFEIEARVDHIGAKSMSVVFDFTRGDDEIASVTMAYVCVESSTKESCAIPDAVREAFTV